MAASKQQIERVKILVREIRDATEDRNESSRMWVDHKDADALAAVLEVVERLPVTRDGVRVIPWVDVLWCVDRKAHGLTARAAWYTLALTNTHDGEILEVNQCYSTESAARAAAEQKGGE